MQLVGQWMCEYQRNRWSRRTVSQTAQHCESSIGIQITAGKPRRWWQHISCETQYISLLSVYFPYLWYQNETLKELKPYNCSKNKNYRGLHLDASKKNRFPGSLQFTLHAESTPLICTLATQFIPLTKSSSPLEKCSLVQKNFKQMCGWLQSVETPSTDQLHWGLGQSPLSPETPDGGAAHQQPFFKNTLYKDFISSLTA